MEDNNRLFVLNYLDKALSAPYDDSDIVDKSTLPEYRATITNIRERLDDEYFEIMIKQKK